jgi:hypothetical protein
MELYKLITNISDFKLYHFEQFIVPTEFVIRSLEPQLPLVARAYYIELYSRRECDEVITYDQLKNLVPNFTESRCANHLYLLEVFEDHGDDGHVDYTLSGYMLVKDKDIEISPYAPESDLLLKKYYRLT